MIFTDYDGQMTELKSSELTVEELAQRVGMSVRNLREWQGLGLLEPPTKRGRVGFYRQSHVERVERVRALRADGFPLDLIRRILEDSAEAEGEIVAFGRTLLDRLQNEEPEVVDLSDFAARFGIGDAAEIQRALDNGWFDRFAALGLMRIRDDGGFEILSPRLARLGEFLLGLGISVEEILELGERVYRHQEAVARIFVEVFRAHVFAPFETAESSDEDWAKIRQTLEELRPFAVDAVDGLFRLAMDNTSKRTIHMALERRGE